MIGGRFRVVRPLGGGASAEVLLALDLTKNQQVAIKLFPRSRVVEDEFRCEASIAMRNAHENLVRLVDAGVHQGRPYLALEYVDGMNGRAVIYHDTRTVALVLDVVRQVFAALCALHHAGLVHGDIKPENVIVQGSMVRVVDFGRTRLAHVLADGGVHAGTAPYMHPKLFQGLPPSPRTDCFATWVMAHEMLTGERPWTRDQLMHAPPDRLPDRVALPRADLETMVQAGLCGRLPDARSSWLAISRFLAGKYDLPTPQPQAPPVLPAQVNELLDKVRQTRSCAVVGDPQATRPLLESLDRAWRRDGGSVVWVTPGWDSDLPLADALSMVADVAESLSGSQLASIALAMGPLASALTSVVPAARAWLDVPTAGPSDRPEPERLALALHRMIGACPSPLLILTRTFHRVDGASRRLLREMVTTGLASLVGATPVDAEHGLATSQSTPPLPWPHGALPEAQLSKAARSLLLRARVLDLALDQTLAQACDLSAKQVTELAWELEAVGLAWWTGDAVLPRPGPLPGPQAQRTIFTQAAARLDAAQQPWRVASYALRGGDQTRLVEVIDAAVDAAARRAPADALELLAADPRPPVAARLLRHFRIALQARDRSAATKVVERLRDTPGVSAADLAEAQGELAFRSGDTLSAIAAYERCAAALGRPVPRGLAGWCHNLWAFWQVFRGVCPTPRPDPRLGRVFGTLYDLHFSHDNAYLPRLLRMWLRAAPTDTRALATEALWRQLLGRAAHAHRIESELAERIHEGTDPVGAAIILMHRAMARLLRGETAAAYSDGVDAATRLLRVGDPYQAALATMVPTTCAIHIADTGSLAGVQRSLLHLVEETGDERAARWAVGQDSIIRWQGGDHQGARSRA
ncbi:MAG: serine/threonine protein kinase, partial [Oligoflexia bacterium]|nr:serine/threonine protein kinase [Oligoflexia bacterium]